MKLVRKKIIAAGVLPVCAKTGRILLNQRGFQQTNGGTWSDFGGSFDEKDKIPKNTAKREFSEETLFKGKYKITSKPFYMFNDNHINYFEFLGVFNHEFVPDIETAGEAMDWGWFDLDNLPEPLHPGLIEMLENKREVLKKIIETQKNKFAEQKSEEWTIIAIQAWPTSFGKLMESEISNNNHIDTQTINLDKDFDELNHKLFNNELSKVKVKWIKSKGKLGIITFQGYYDVDYIGISNFYKLTRQQYLDVLAHEMIHAYIFEKKIRDTGDHGIKFIEMVNKLNAQYPEFNIKKSENAADYFVSSDKKKDYGVLLFDMDGEYSGVIVDVSLVENESVLNTFFDSLRKYSDNVYGNIFRAYKNVKINVYKSDIPELASFKVKRVLNLKNLSFFVIPHELKNKIEQGKLIKTVILKESQLTESIVPNNMKHQIDKLNKLLAKDNAGTIRYTVKNISEIKACDISSVSSIETSQYKELWNDIKENGMVPILMSEEGYVMDGCHRFYLLKKHGIKKIPVLQVSGPWFKDDEKNMNFDVEYKNNTPLVKVI